MFKRCYNIVITKRIIYEIYLKVEGVVKHCYMVYIYNYQNPDKNQGT